MNGYGMSFYDHMHAGEYEDEQHRARAVGTVENLVIGHPGSAGWPDDNTRQQQQAHQRELELQQQELENERQDMRIRAVRACLTHGVPMDTIHLLCEELGVSYNKVSGG